jgi:hypothetical protein
MPVRRKLAALSALSLSALGLVACGSDKFAAPVAETTSNDATSTTEAEAPEPSTTTTAESVESVESRRLQSLIRAAPAAMVEAGSARISLVLDVAPRDEMPPFDVPGRGAREVTMEGVVDMQSGDASILLDIAALLPGDIEADPAGVRIVAGTMYLDVGSFMAYLADQEGEDVPTEFDFKWVKMDLDALGGADSPGSNPNAWAQNLGYLLAAADVEQVGIEEVRGGEATKYHVTVSADEIVKAADDQLDGVPDYVMDALEAGLDAFAGDIEIDVWLDRAGLMHKMQMELPPAGFLASEDAGLSMTMEMYDFGVTVNVKAPRNAKDFADIQDLFAGSAAG